MKKSMRKAFILMICFALLLGGCSDKNDLQNQNGDGAVGENVASGQPAGSMTGKYVQQDVTPPQFDGGTVDQIRQLPDGRILVMGHLEGQAPKAYTTLDGSVWEETYSLVGAGALDAYPEQSKTYTVDNNGIWWVTVSTSEGDDNHLFKIQDGSAEEIGVGIFQTRQAGRVMDILPGTDNTVLLWTMVPGDQMEWTVIDCDAGREISSFKPASFYPSFTDYREGKVYACAGDGNGPLYVFDASTGKQETNHPLPEGVSLGVRPVANISDDNSFVYVDTAGIYKVALGGGYLQTVTDTHSYAFADSTARLAKLCAANDDSFWMVCYPQQKLRLYRYVFDPDAPVVSANSLYIWTMENNALLQLAVSSFAQQNPDCEVVLEVARGTDASAQTDEDIIRALNTQMLGGDVPDVLILDGLPIDSMIKQGLLTDLSGIVNEVDYYYNILSCYTRDGNAFAYPTMFWIPAMVQSAKAESYDISSMQTLDDLRPLITKPDQLYLGGYYHVFNSLYAASAPSIFPDNTRVDENALRTFLSVTQDTVAAHGLSGQEYVPGWEEMMVSDGIGNFVAPIEPSLNQLYRGENQGLPYAMGILYEYFSAINMSHNYNGPAGRFAPLPGNTFVPRCVAGVPVGAANTDGGKQFIKTLFECQTAENARYTSFPGFLVRRGLEMQLGVETAEEANNDPNIPYDFPNPQNSNIEELIAALQTPSPIDSVLESKVYEQAKNLYMGYTDLDTAVATILQNTQLYFAERQ